MEFDPGNVKEEVRKYLELILLIGRTLDWNGLSNHIKWSIRDNRRQVFLRRYVQSHESTNLISN